MHSIAYPPRLTFAVLGDNRGDSYGEQPAIVAEMVRAVNEAAPQLVLQCRRHDQRPSGALLAGGEAFAGWILVGNSKSA
jgi:hypothetical protein